MNAYFDTSALIKLVVTEAGSDLAHALWGDSDMAMTNRVAYVEARSALAAARRAGRLAAGAVSESRRALEERFRAIEMIELTPALVRSAADLADEHALRGYDAIHLASALTLDPDDTVLVTWDRELAWGGYAAGLSLAGIQLD